MEEKIEDINIAITSSPVQTIHEISLEYYFKGQESQVILWNSSSHI